MRSAADHNPLHPGVIFRQGASFGAMWKGETRYFNRYGGAEAYILARNRGLGPEHALQIATEWEANAARNEANARVTQRTSESSVPAAVAGPEPLTRIDIGADPAFGEVVAGDSID